MAGYIHITEDAGLSMGSTVFDAIVELSRPFFASEHKHHIEEIYEMRDQGGLDAISLTEQGVDGFNAYHRGVRRTYQEYFERIVPDLGAGPGNRGKLDLLPRNWFD